MADGEVVDFPFTVEGSRSGGYGYTPCQDTGEDPCRRRSDCCT